MNTLTLEHISYKYKKADKNVLKDVSCHFSSGGMAAVIGPSGSGKTTFLSILAVSDVVWKMADRELRPDVKPEA